MCSMGGVLTGATLLAAMAACGPAPEAKKPSEPSASAAVEDACIDSPPPWRKYDGPCAKCAETEQFLTWGMRDLVEVRILHLEKPAARRSTTPDDQAQKRA